MVGETRYAESGDVQIAYQVLGEGSLDLILVAEFWHAIEAQWDQPDLAEFLLRLGSFGRLVTFDQRGTGVSDPIPRDEPPSLEQWLDDVSGVMDAVGSKEAVLVGMGGGGSLSMLFAATYPERTAGLVLVNSFPRLTQASDYEWGRAPAVEDEVLHVMRTGWGRGVLLDVVAPSKVGDESFRQWWAKYQRLGSSPGTIVRMRRMVDEFDIRDVLPSIRVPTLVLHRAGNTFVRVEHGRYLAERIPGARYVEGATDLGRSYLGFTTRPYGESSSDSVARKSILPATASSPRSMDPHVQFDAPSLSAKQSNRSVSKSEPESTPARSSSRMGRFAGWPFTSASAFSLRPKPARFLFRAQ